MKGQPSKELANSYGIRAEGLNTKIDTANLNILTDLVEKGAIKVNIEKIFPLSNIRDAFAYKDNNSVRGKVILKIK